MVQRLWIVFLAVCISCKPGPQQDTAPGTGPTVRATVVTIRSVTTPGDQAVTHSLVIAGNRVRDLRERDVWRLFDTEKQTVTFVDEIAKTVHTRAFADLRQERLAAIAKNLAPFHPTPELTRSDARRTIAGAPAQQWLITAGAYRRELWMGDHPSIPRGLFAMMQASERVSSPLAPMMRDVEPELLTATAFPLADRTEVPVGEQPMIVDQTVVSVTQKDVPATLVTPPKEYRDLTPRPARESG